MWKLTFDLPFWKNHSMSLLPWLNCGILKYRLSKKELLGSEIIKTVSPIGRKMGNRKYIQCTWLGYLSSKYRLIHINTILRHINTFGFFFFFISRGNLLCNSKLFLNEFIKDIVNIFYSLIHQLGIHKFVNYVRTN